MTDDPTASLEAKLTVFAEGLDEDERRVFHDVLHLAAGGAEVEGFAARRLPAGVAACPCDGGEITFPGTLDMLGTLHVKLRIPPRPRKR
jgi:hypothetical protein